MSARRLALEALRRGSPRWSDDEGGAFHFAAIEALEAELAQAVQPTDAPSCWYCDFGQYGQITMRRDEADTAAASGAKVTSYTAGSMRAVNAELLDAQRYRHLRDSKTLDQWIWDALDHAEGDAYSKGLDDAIDAAIAKATGGAA